MAFFELWPPRSDAKFSEFGPFSQILTRQLRLELLEEETVALSAQPTGGKLVVTALNPGFAKIEKIQEASPTTTIYKVTGIAEGECLIEARMPQSSRASGMPSGIIAIDASLASLNITVIDKNAVVADSDFVAGFTDGFGQFAGKAGEIALDKISKDPVAFVEAVHLGVADGLLEGLVSLVKAVWEVLKLGLAFSPPGLVVNTTRYIFDESFRNEIKKHVADAQRMAETISALAFDVAMNRKRLAGIFKVNGKAIGRIVGEEMGREVQAQATKKTAADIGKWVGFIIGRVMFEVIFILATEGIGMAAGAGKAAGEGASLAARLLPRIRALLGPLRELEAFIKGRLGIKAVVEAADVLKAYVNLNPRAVAEEIALGRWLDEMAQQGRLGDVGRVRGMPEVAGASPDYNFLSKGVDPSDITVAGRRADAVIAESRNLNNVIGNAIGSKAGRQAENIIIEIGSRGSSAGIPDAEITAWKVTDVAPMSPSLQRLIFVRNSGGARSIVLDMRVR